MAPSDETLLRLTRELAVPQEEVFGRKRLAERL
jgi:hypothetical protein